MTYTIRALARAPLFSAVCILLLTFGLGLNTALFSMVDAVVLRALPYHEPNKLIEVFGIDSARDGLRIPGELVDAIRARSRTIKALTIHGPVGAVLRTAEGPIDVRGDHAWANFNEIYGVAPSIGRPFRAGDDATDASPVVLVSHAFWQRFLGGDSSAVGKSITLDSTDYTVVGVMPASFRTNYRGDQEFFWTPQVSAQLREFEGESGYELVARMASGSELPAVQHELASIVNGAGVEGWGRGARLVNAKALSDEVVGSSARVITLAFGAVALVLLITCANLAMLSLARAESRAFEFAARKAIGASTLSLVWLALSESVVLSLAGGVLGSVLAYWLLPAMVALAPSAIPRLANAVIDIRVLGITFVFTMASACLAGALPAFRLSRLSPATLLNRTSLRAASGTSRLRSGLVIAQVAGAVVLVVVAGLADRTLHALSPSEPGFDARGVFGFVVYADPRVYPDASMRRDRFTGIVNRLGEVPGISAASIADNIPFAGDTPGTPVARADGSPSTAVRTVVMPNYFSLMGIRMLTGRTFDAADAGGGERVAIVSRSLASTLSPSGNAVGLRVMVGRAKVEHTIVGVVDDVRMNGATSERAAAVYVAFSQAAPSVIFVVVRSSASPEHTTQAIRSEIRRAFPNLPLALNPFARSMDTMVRDALAAPRFLATLASVFSAAALALSAIGVFGLVAYAVSSRRRELGIRAALGARARDLTGLALRSAMLLSGAGVLVGLGASAYVSRFVAKQLYGVSPLDTPTFALAAVVLLLVTFIAAALPSRRAGMVDPMSVLRE